MAEKPVEFLMTQVDPEGDRVNVVQLLTNLQTFDVLAKGFLPEQMCTHLPTVQGNHTFALHSYTQNVSLEVAFHGQRRDPKVTLLNAMHEQLKAQLGLALYRKSAAELGAIR